MARNTQIHSSIPRNQVAIPREDVQHPSGHAEEKLDSPSEQTPTQPSAECPACHSNHAEHGYMAEKDRYLKRMKRIEGQARGITRMIEEEKYCIDILTQISALTKALQAVGLGLLDEHLNHCVLNAAQQGGSEAEEKLAEASKAIARLVKS